MLTAVLRDAQDGMGKSPTATFPSGFPILRIDHVFVTHAQSEALALSDRAIPVVERAENAVLLATLLMMRAEANGALGRDAQAREARLDSLGWARYGFGTDALVRARLSDIADLAASGRRG